MSHLGVLKNRSSADREVIEGGKDRGGERNGVTVMVSCLLLVSCPDPFGKIEKGSGNTAYNLPCSIPAITQPYANVICVVKIEGVRSCMVCVIGSFSK